MMTFRSVIELWPTREQCAAEIGATASQVSKWWQRNSIPAEWWTAILQSPTGRAAGLEAAAFAAIADDRRETAVTEARA